MRGGAVVHPDRREVERNGVGRESERVQAGVEAVERLLDGGDHRGEGVELGDGSAVDAAQALVLERDGHPAFARGLPRAAGDVPEEGGVGFVGDGAGRHGREAAQVEREAGGEGRDVFALVAELLLGARDAAPEAQLGDFAGEAAAERRGADADGVEGRDLRGGEARPVGVVERGDGRRAAARADDRDVGRDAGLERAERRRDALAGGKEHLLAALVGVGGVGAVLLVVGAVPVAFERRRRGDGGGEEVVRRERGRRVRAEEAALDDGGAVRDGDLGVVVEVVGVVERVGEEQVGDVVGHGGGDDVLGEERERERRGERQADAARLAVVEGEDGHLPRGRLAVRGGLDLQLERPRGGAGERRERVVPGVAGDLDRGVVAVEDVAPVAAGGWLLGEERVGDDPVGEGAVAAARGPFAVAEGAGGVLVEVAGGGDAAGVAHGLARGAVDDGERDLGDVLRGLGEGRLVVVVDVERDVGDDHLAHRGLAPGEERVAQEAVVAGKRGEVVAVGVAVALRVHQRRLLVVDEAGVAAADVVVHRVGDLAGGDAAGEVPDEAVVVGRDLERAGGVGAGAAAQERELLIEERRDLVVEGEERGRERAVVHLEARHHRVVEVGAEADRRVERVGVRLVAEQVVEVGEAADGELELLVGVGVVDPERERHRLGLVEERLVELDQAHLGEVVLVERDVALEGRAGLAHHRDDGLGGVLLEVAHPLREGRDVVEDALHPALGERGRVGPGGPRVPHRGVGRRVGVRGLVPDGVVGVHHVREGVALLADDEARQALRLVERELERVVLLGVGGRRAVVVRARAAPLEDVVVGPAGEGLGVEDRELLREEVERVLARDDAADVVLRHDLEDPHLDRVAGRDGHELVRGVVLDERDVVRGAHREERVVVARLVGDAVFEDGDGLVRAREDGPRGEPPDRRLPLRDVARLGGVVDEAFENLALGGGRDVHVQQLDAAGIVLLLADEDEAVAEVARGVEVEARGERGRKAVEVVLALAERRVAAGTGLDAERGDGGGKRVVVGGREAGGLRDGGVE